MNWPDIAGLGVVGSSLLLLLLYAMRKLLSAMDVCVSAHQERIRPRLQGCFRGEGKLDALDKPDSSQR